MDAKELATIFASGGGGAVLLALITGAFKWLSGASGRERQKNTDAIAQRRDAIADREKSDRERDAADDKRREAEEHVAILQRQLRLLGEVPLERPTNN
jgi:hypothetical protein